MMLMAVPIPFSLFCVDELIPLLQEIPIANASYKSGRVSVARRLLKVLDTRHQCNKRIGDGAAPRDEDNNFTETGVRSLNLCPFWGSWLTPLVVKYVLRPCSIGS